jgi:hypothetical protein
MKQKTQIAFYLVKKFNLLFKNIPTNETLGPDGFVLTNTKKRNSKVFTKNLSEN